MEQRLMKDWALISASRESEETFAILFERHKHFVFRLARALSGSADLAEEIIQEVFCRLYAKRRHWKKKASFRTLLYRITVNTSREILRRQPKFQPLEPHHSNSTAQPNGEEKEQVYIQLETYIDWLPPKQREVIVLRFFENLRIKDIAMVLGCREGTVKAHLFRAKQNLRKRFEGRHE